MVQESYKDLIVWQKAMDLVDAVFDVTECYPREHLYGLTAQTCKSVVSIPSNIAEGRRRGTDSEFRYFLTVAFASGAELETQIEIAKRRPFGKACDFSRIDILLNEVMCMLNTLVRKYS